MKVIWLLLLCIPLLVFGEGRGEAPRTESEIERYRDEANGPDADLREEVKWKERRDAMVTSTIESRGVTDPDVLKAMRNVPRHLFVPREMRGKAYTDQPLPIGYGQTISQPYIVAYMTEILELEPGDKVLEVGTGSGYQAAVLAEITDEVYTIEIIEELAESAGKRLHDIGYDEVQVKNADGYFGWEEYAPFDAIIVTAAAGHVPPPLVKQLAPGGSIIIPIGGVYQVQQLTLLQKNEAGEIRTKQLMAVRFVPFTGEAENPDTDKE